MNLKESVRRLIVSVITFEARMVLKKYKPRIAVISGSVGKTSTKDALYATLSERFFVRRSEKSYNSDIGVPLTILGVPNGWSDPLRWIRNMFEGLILILIFNCFFRCRGRRFFRVGGRQVNFYDRVDEGGFFNFDLFEIFIFLVRVKIDEFQIVKTFSLVIKSIKLQKILLIFDYYGYRRSN